MSKSKFEKTVKNETKEAAFLNPESFEEGHSQLDGLESSQGPHIKSNHCEPLYFYLSIRAPLVKHGC